MELILENVRCFVGKHVVPIKPLTILVGENSSGKTTLLAALSAVCDPKGFPFNPRFNEAPYNLGNFDTIASQKNGRSDRADSFSLGYIVPSAPDPTDVRARYKSNKGQVRLSAFKVKAPEGEAGLRLHDYQRVYLVELTIPWRGQQDTTKFRVDEIFEEDSTQDSKSSIYYQLMMVQQRELMKVQQGGKALELDAEWLGGAFAVFHHLSPTKTVSIAPIRTKPRRTYDQATESFHPEGDHIPFLLARMLDSKAGKSLISVLRRFGQESGLFKDIQVKRLGEDLGDPFQVMISVGGRSANIIEVGYGVSQALPIVIQSILAAEERLILIQQPEVHLHPKAQAALGSFFVDMVAEGSKQFVIETHSDYIVDRIRQEVAAGKMKSDSVSILFFEKSGIETTIHQLTIDDLGNVVGAPPTYREFFLSERMSLLGRGRR